MSNDEAKAWLGAAREIALEAGALIKDMSKAGPKVSKKGPIDLVTEADLKAERLIVDRLSQCFPEHSVLAEEGGGETSTGPMWVIDPIDGTTNYAHGFPAYAVSIALMVGRRSVVGVVYEPNLDELFTAIRGSGASLNGEPIEVSSVNILDDALLATGFPYSLREEPERIISDFSKILLSCQGVRRAGAATLDICNLAAGRFDGFWERGLKPWDTAAAALVLLEAGGLLTRLDGGPFDHFVPEVVASNGHLHERLLSFFKP